MKEKNSLLIPLAPFFLRSKSLLGESLSLLCLVFRSYIQTEYLNYTLIASTSMGVLNLLPCLPLDGGRILRASLSLGSDAVSAWRTTMKISRVTSSVILIAGVYLLLTQSFQFSLILIGIFLGNFLSLENVTLNGNFLPRRN